MNKPVDANGTDRIIKRPFMQEVRKGLAAGHFKKFVGVKKTHPRMPITKHFHTSGVVFFLNTFPRA